MGDIFREVDEELRQDRAERLWKAYGSYVLAAAVAVVVAVAGWQWRGQYTTSRNIAFGVQFAEAESAIRQNPTDAVNQFAKLAEAAGTAGYGVLARFHQAALKAQAGDSKGAITIYESLASGSDVDQPLRDAALILAALHALDFPETDMAALGRRIEPLVAPRGPWRHSAHEILGILARKSGNNTAAREHFQSIADDLDAPQGIRARAAELLATLPN